MIVSKPTTLNPPLKLSLRAARILSLLVLGGIGIGYLGGAIFGFLYTQYGHVRDIEHIFA